MHGQRGKVISRVVIVVVSTKIAISRDLGTHKHNESIELGKKLTSEYFKSRDMIHDP